MTEQLITTEELAKQLKIPISWVYGRTRKKDENAIPVIRVGKYCRFRLGEVFPAEGKIFCKFFMPGN